ncbi:MAG: RNA polymerase sigma factor RpoD/SigA [Spirochaetales bacterium]
MAEPKKTRAVPRRGRYSDDDANVLSTYLREINQIPLLTREEEDFYSRRAREGDEEAKAVLARANLRFVVNVAKRYRNQGLPLSDLISEGNIGLINAIERFDPDKGYHFISYAVWWIRQAITKAIYEKARMIRLPQNRIFELSRIEKTRTQLQSDRGRDPGVDDVAKALDMDGTHVASMLNISRDHVSLETPISKDKDPSLLGDFVEDTDRDTPEEETMESALRDEINKVLESLSDREATIIQYRFGLNGKQPLSLQELGNRFSLTKERIRQIEQRALRKLRDPERSERLQSYIA